MQVIIPMSPHIHTLPSVDRMLAARMPVTETAEPQSGDETFLDALLGVWNNAADAQAAKTDDMANIMLGDTDSLESLQINIAKAEIATELLVNIKNSVVDAYNELMRMSI